MSRQLSVGEFVDLATAPVAAPEEAEKVDPADKAAMDRMYQAFGPKQMESGRRSDSIFRRLHAETANVARGDGSTHVVPAATRTQGDSRLPKSSSKFQMARDWDPSDPANKKGPR